MDPFSKRWVHNCLGCWTNGNWFWKVWLSTFSDPCYFRAESFYVVLFFI
jgi:hypothetical protein